MIVLFILLLFVAKVKAVELLLESFVRIVDAELFETVAAKGLETENIQHTNVRAFVVAPLASLLVTEALIPATS